MYNLTTGLNIIYYRERENFISGPFDIAIINAMSNLWIFMYVLEDIYIYIYIYTSKILHRLENIIIIVIYHNGRILSLLNDTYLPHRMYSIATHITKIYSVIYYFSFEINHQNMLNGITSIFLDLYQLTLLYPHIHYNWV